MVGLFFFSGSQKHRVTSKPLASENVDIYQAAVFL